MDDGLSAILLDDTRDSDIKEEDVGKFASLLQSRTAQFTSQNNFQPPASLTEQQRQIANFRNELLFTKFLDFAKSKLPLEQQTILSTLNSQFSKKEITFDEYRERLKNGIGKIKFDYFVAQYRNFQEQKRKALLEQQQSKKAGQMGLYPVNVANMSANYGSVSVPHMPNTSSSPAGIVDLAPHTNESRSSPLLHHSSSGNTTLIDNKILHKRIDSITDTNNISTVEEDMYEFIELALEERIRSVLQELVIIAKKKKKR